MSHLRNISNSVNDVHVKSVEEELNWTESHQDELNTQLLKASIAREGNKKRKDDSKEKEYRKLLEISLSYVNRFEALWERAFGKYADLPTDIFSPEEMEEYCSHAKFLVTCLKREYNIVSLVEEKMKEWKV